jgi:hypothetical protein
MSDVTLQAFAYGEELDTFGQRSLGYRLLAPAGTEPWGCEVEALARRLQAAPYPDQWPSANLFCSILLADGRRVVAVAHYGLVDCTPEQRRGGLELIGVVASGEVSIPATLAVYRWLQIRRDETDDLHVLGGQFPLREIVSAMPPMAATAIPAPVLPIRVWQCGAILLGATSASDPDRQLGLLERSPQASWQWLPLVGADFPLQHQARLGPLVAWTPYLDVASECVPPGLW